MNTKDKLVKFVDNSRCFLDNLTGAFFIKDLDSNFIECNQVLSRLFKVQKNNILGKSDYNLPWADFADLYRRHDSEAVTKRNINVLESVPIKGKILNIQTKKSAIQDKSGIIIGVFAQISALSFNNNIGSALLPLSLLDKKNMGLSKKIHQTYQVSDYSPALKLTTREAECLFLLIRGKSAKEIGRFLDISFRTVEEYLENIKHKMGVASRSELITKSIETGMIEIIPKDEIFIKLSENAKKWKDFLF